MQYNYDIHVVYIVNSRINVSRFKSGLASHFLHSFNDTFHSTSYSYTTIDVN